MHRPIAAKHALYYVLILKRPVILVLLLQWTLHRFELVSVHESSFRVIAHSVRLQPDRFCASTLPTFQYWRKVRLNRPSMPSVGGAVPGMMRDTP